MLSEAIKLAKKKKRKGKTTWCVKAGKTTVSCHTKKSAARKKAAARRKRGLKARIVKRKRKR